MKRSDISDFLLHLQGVANDIANQMLDCMTQGDAETVRLVRSELDGFVVTTSKASYNKLKSLEKKLSGVRSRTIANAKSVFLDAAGKVASIAADNAVNEIRQTLEEAANNDLEVRKKLLNPKLPDEKIEEILKYTPFASSKGQAETIEKWFKHWEENDVKRIIGTVTAGMVEGLDLKSLIKRFQESSPYYPKGDFRRSHESARGIARTLINGVANAGKLEMYRQNADVIDGVKWLSTLDSRICPICAALDGKIWLPDQLDQVQRPPAHISCRCALIPYIDLGPEFDADRPAERKNFELAAEERYNQKQEKKGSNKRWNDLSYDYRKQLRYKEMRNWSKAHGNASPYKQVKSSDSFREYFETLSDKDKRDWLGETRYGMYLAGDLKPDQLANPDEGYVKGLDELRKDIESEKRGTTGSESSWLDGFDPKDYPERSEKNWDEPLATAFIESLSEEERNIVSEWTTGYRDINQPIRNDKIAPWQQNKIDKLSEIIDQHAVPANARMYRVVGKDYLPAMMRRGIYFVEGAEISMEEFTATSMSKKAAKKTAKDFERYGAKKQIEFEFYVPAGSHAIPLSKSPPYDKKTGKPKFEFQKEWLFQKNMTIRVIEKKEFQDGRVRIKALIVDTSQKK